MRTTLNLPDALVTASKERARSQGKTLTSFIEDALRARLDEEAVPEPREPLPVWGRPDGKILVDLADKDSVWTVLDQDPGTVAPGDETGRP